MLLKIPSVYKYRLLVFLTLALASAMVGAMVLARSAYTGRLVYRFFIWNIFLAWLPLLFALLATRFARWRLLLLGCGLAWLVFLPNAPYLVTDIMHLRLQSEFLFWYDLILFFFAAVTGLFLGLTSLYLMQSLVARLWGSLVSWLFVTVSLGLSAYGVFLGRFLRWNSWDVFFNPTHLLADVLATAADPYLRLRIFAISLLFMIVFLFAYVILFSLPRIATDP